MFAIFQDELESLRSGRSSGGKGGGEEKKVDVAGVKAGEGEGEGKEVQKRERGLGREGRKVPFFSPTFNACYAG